MRKVFMFRRGYDSFDIYPLTVIINRENGAIYIDGHDVSVILELSYNDLSDFVVSKTFFYFTPKSLLKMLSVKPHLDKYSFKTWCESTIFPSIIKEFNTFTSNDLLFEISEKLDKLNDLLEKELECVHTLTNADMTASVDNTVDTGQEK